MKSFLPVFCCFLSASGLQSQATFFIPDTILLQTFTVDPSDTMLIFPTGNDLHWVNWDADNEPTLCGNPGEIIPGNWYWESDFGDMHNPPINSAFTSCSYLLDTLEPNENWLITPPIHIPDSATVLHWRSLSLQGPAFLDGYKILVSTSTNEPFTGAFVDTIFVAAEMLTYPEPLTLNPNHYTFSSGYIHANRYTNPNYYFLITPNAGAYTGRLEPHGVSLKKYAGQTIYIAFLHDSTNDLVLQLDDIAIIHGETTSDFEPGAPNYFLQIQPNPVGASCTISWKFPIRQEGHLLLRDMFGRTISEHFVDLGAGLFQLNTESWPTGTYACTLLTTTGRQTILLVKQ